MKAIHSVPVVTSEFQAIKEIQAMKMMDMKIAGCTQQEIATTFNCSLDTVQRRLKWAGTTGLTQKYETDILSKLVPKAIDVYEAKLTAEDPDAAVAKDVLDKLVKLGDRYEQRETKQREMGLEAYVATLNNQQPRTDTTVVAAVPASLPATITPVDSPKTPAIRAGDEKTETDIEPDLGQFGLS